MEKIVISFDFDFTLSDNVFAQEMCKWFRQYPEQFTLIITTRRFREEFNQPNIIKFIKQYGFELSDVTFCSRGYKWRSLIENKVSIHFDDDKEELLQAHENLGDELPFTIEIVAEEHSMYHKVPSGLHLKQIKYGSDSEVQLALKKCITKYHSLFTRLGKM